jgi:cytochrome-b5 reductase
MLVGGTGITPMIQALHVMLVSHEKPKKPVVTMLYGSKVSSDILGNEVLAQWAKDYPDQFQLTHVLSHEPDDSTWNDGVRGYITQELIADQFPFPPNDSSKKILVFVCGPPPMYNALCGPRDDKDKVSGILGEMGYTPSQVYKF